MFFWQARDPLGFCGIPYMPAVERMLKSCSLILPDFFKRLVPKFHFCQIHSLHLIYSVKKITKINVFCHKSQNKIFVCLATSLHSESNVLLIHSLFYLLLKSACGYKKLNDHQNPPPPNAHTHTHTH